MRFGTTAIFLLTAITLIAPAAAQTTPATSAITRTVVAKAILPNVTEMPLHFKAVNVTLPPGETSSVSTPNGILYQISGSTEVSTGGEVKILDVGDGLFIAGGKTAKLKAGSGGPSALLHFFLSPTDDLDRPVATAPALVKELYRTAAPIPDLKPGAYDLNLTRVIFPPQMLSNPPVHRSGAREHSTRRRQKIGHTATMSVRTTFCGGIRVSSASAIDGYLRVLPRIG